MKKRWMVGVLAVLFLAVLPMAATAQDAPQFSKGNLALSGGVGFSYWGGVSLYPGVEFILTEIPITPAVPIVIGLEGKGLVSFGGVWSVFGAGALATGHFSFRTLDLETRVLDPVDVYIGLGLAFTVSDFWGVDGTALRFASVDGINYFLNERLALFLEYNYWGVSAGTFGVLYKL